MKIKRLKINFKVFKFISLTQNFYLNLFFVKIRFCAHFKVGTRVLSIATFIFYNAM